MQGKKVTVFMVEGTEFGPRTIEIGNWSGVALYTPRSSANEFLNRIEFDNCGIYILKSVPSAGNYSEQIYIGEAEVLRKRIKEHLKDTDKDFFTEIIAFTSKILTKAHIRFLEGKLIAEAKAAKSSLIENCNTTSLPFLPEADVSDMIFFLDQIRLILPISGFKFLIPTVLNKRDLDSKAKNPIPKNDEEYHIKHTYLKALMVEDDRGFIVIQGSQANKHKSKSMTDTYVKLRNKLIEEGTLIEKNEWFEFSADTIFSSISAASNVVLGRQSNGNTEWVNGAGKSFKDRQNEIYGGIN